MKNALAAAAIGLSGLAAIPAQAMQIAPLSASATYVTLVAGGCGIGFHRGPYGGCRPNGYGVAGVPGYGYGYHGGYGYGYHGGYRYGGAYRYGRGGGGYHYGPHVGYHYHYHY